MKNINHEGIVYATMMIFITFFHQISTTIWTKEYICRICRMTDRATSERDISHQKKRQENYFIKLQYRDIIHLKKKKKKCENRRSKLKDRKDSIDKKANEDFFTFVYKIAILGYIQLKTKNTN